MIFRVDIKSLTIYISGIILMLGILGGCDDNENFKMGEDLVDVKTNLSVLDTFTLNMSTVKADSIQTSGYGKILVGRCIDGDLGTVTSRSYTRLFPESYNYSIGDECKFDSICLFMYHTGYSYGDTLQNSTIEIHRLTRNLNRYSNNNPWYNHDTIDYVRETVLCQFIYKPKPKRKKELTCRLPDAFGQQLFDSIYNSSTVFYTEENFLKFFKGIAVVPGTQNSAIVQFDTLYINLYYHDGDVDKVFTMNSNMSSSYNFQFNNIQSVLNAPLNALTNQKIKIGSEETGKRAYCQAGTGLLTRIDIPTFNNLKKSATYLKIMKAQLILTPVKGTYKPNDLPTDLSLYYTNERNKMVSALTGNNGYTLQPYLYIDELFGDETSYTYDVTDYINYFYNQTTDDNTPSFLVSLPADDFASSLKRITIDNSKYLANTSKLKIYYWFTNVKQ
jgi:hypothetical protein